jgi:hypothetical protein
VDRRILWSVSFGNLVYLRAWTSLVVTYSEDAFYRKHMPSLTQYLAVGFDVLLLAALTYALFRAAPDFPGWIQRGLFLAGVLLIGLGLRGAAAPSTPLLTTMVFHVLSARTLALSVVLAGAVLAALVLRWFRWSIRIARVALMAALPCAGITFGGIPFVVSGYPQLRDNPAPSPSVRTPPAMRVVWMVFDEWDAHRTFDLMPADQLPALQGLRSRSFSARALAAQAPLPVGDQRTALAIPSLLYGKRVTAGKIDSPGNMRLTFEDGSTERLGAGAHIFADARQRRWQVGLAGWYLPYCREFEGISDCYWNPLYRMDNSVPEDFAGAAIAESRMLFEFTGYSIFGRSLATAMHVREFEEITAAAKRMAADPSLGLIFVHVNAPHPPFFAGTHTYRDALMLVDRTIGQIEVALRQSGLDKNTALILTSDHPARFTDDAAGLDPHVPLIVHLPGETSGLECNRKFSALRSAALAIELGEGRIATPQQVADFLTAR